VGGLAGHTDVLARRTFVSLPSLSIVVATYYTIAPPLSNYLTALGKDLLLDVGVDGGSSECILSHIVFLAETVPDLPSSFCNNKKQMYHEKKVFLCILASS